MKACTYFIIAIILFLTSFGAMTTTAAFATLAVSIITFAGGIYTKYVL